MLELHIYESKWCGQWPWTASKVIRDVFGIPCTARIRGVLPFAYWALILVHGKAINSLAFTSRPVKIAARRPMLSRFSRHMFLWWTLRQATSSMSSGKRQHAVAFTKLETTRGKKTFSVWPREQVLLFRIDRVKAKLDNIAFETKKCDHLLLADRLT